LIKEIIKFYKPQKGFMDLSIKPQNLSKKLYLKILRIQMFLMEQNKNLDYFKRPYNKIEFSKLKELSANLQNIIMHYWEI